MSYAVSGDLIARYDARDVCELASDTAAAIAIADLATNAKVLACLADAEGDVIGALMAGNRYTAADLTALTGASLAKLKRLICSRAMYYLLDRRPAYDPDRLKAFDAMTEKQLERLRKGEHIFDIEETKDAGVIDHEYPTAANTEKLELMRSRTRNYFPARRYPRK